MFYSSIRPTTTSLHTPDSEPDDEPIKQITLVPPPNRKRANPSSTAAEAVHKIQQNAAVSIVATKKRAAPTETALIDLSIEDDDDDNVNNNNAAAAENQAINTGRRTSIQARKSSAAAPVVRRRAQMSTSTAGGRLLMKHRIAAGRLSNGGSVTPLLCPNAGCSMRFVGNESLQRHLASVHQQAIRAPMGGGQMANGGGGQRAYRCYCGDRFMDGDGLRKHTRRVHGFNGVSYIMNFDNKMRDYMEL